MKRSKWSDWQSSLLTLLLLLLALPGSAKSDVQLTSPDGNLSFSFNLSPTAPMYSVSFKTQVLIQDAILGLTFEDGPFAANLAMLKPRFHAADEQYELLVGKTHYAHDQHREALIPLIERGGAKRRVNIAIRVFNDGIALRYEFPEQTSRDSLILLDENTTFPVKGNPIVHTLFWGNYNNTHEGVYQQLPVQEVPPDTLMDLPIFFECSKKIYMAITEANLRDYAGMYLIKHDGVLKSQLSPLPGQIQVKVKAGLPHQSPWRVLMISDKPGQLISSNILTSLCEPPAEQDWSWLKPGKTTFHWWNGDIVPDTSFAPGINFETNKYYIDFCAKNGLAYHSVIGYGGFAWYQSDAPNYGTVGPHTDVTKTVPSLNIQQICDYAQKKGVGIHVWVHWKAIYPNLEKAFSQFEQWGIKGMMVDFLERDDQEMVKIQEEILKKAAEHHLFIQFHGAYKPTGLHRTYPNEFTREGTLNYENNKWMQSGLSPTHDLDIVFTRLLAGAADYHLGGFRAVPPRAFKPQYTRPLMIGTRCHMLAMYVVLESYLQMIADYPAAYEGEPGFDFLRVVPTSWDETVVPLAAVNQYVAIARRKGSDWYVGSINNLEAKTVTLPLDFLSQGSYIAVCYADAEDTEVHPNHLIKSVKRVTNQDKLQMHLAVGGGQVIRLIKQK